jgi:hypothetical protein
LATGGVEAGRAKVGFISYGRKRRCKGANTVNSDFEMMNAFFRLDPETGKLYWKVARGGVSIGDHAGTDGPGGYLTVGANNKSYYVHRIIFLLVHGKWPTGVCDHADRNTKNNKPNNIRDSTHVENMMNSKTRKDNKSGHRGVFFNTREGKWEAKKRGKSLGAWHDKAKAVDAYENAL